MGSQAKSGNQELFFKCPKCGSLFSTTRSILEQDRYTKGTLTHAFLGGLISPLARALKCTRCSTKLERISEEEFNQLMEKPGQVEP